jgi:hypothetical protein
MCWLLRLSSPSLPVHETKHLLLLPVGMTMKGCCFHYTQCIWRKVQATGLVINYKDEPEIHRLIRRASVSPLVPQAAIEDVWLPSNFPFQREPNC